MNPAVRRWSKIFPVIGPGPRCRLPRSIWKANTELALRDVASDKFSVDHFPMYSNLLTTVSMDASFWNPFQPTLWYTVILSKGFQVTWAYVALPFNNLSSNLIIYSYFLKGFSNYMKIYSYSLFGKDAAASDESSQHANLLSPLLPDFLFLAGHTNLHWNRLTWASFP